MPEVRTYTGARPKNPKRNFDSYAWNHAKFILKYAYQEVIAESKFPNDVHYWAGEVLLAAYAHLQREELSTMQLFWQILETEEHWKEEEQNGKEI